MKQHDVIISGNHLELTDALKSAVREKVEKLFNHEDRIVRLRVELSKSQTPSLDDGFIAKGIIEISGPTIVVSCETGDLYKSIDELVDKLDRKLRRRSRLQRVKRKHARPVELPASLPKATPV